MMVKKMTKKKMATKVVRKKNVVTKYALVLREDMENINPDDSFDIYEVKTSYQHAVNSYLKNEGEEEDLDNMCLIEIKMLGKPMVKTTREITIKK